MDAIGSVLASGTNVLQNVLMQAVESGRKLADNQIRQEQDFANERRDLRLLGERRGNELQRRYEATRAFDESVMRDRRDFAEGARRDARDFAFKEANADRAFGLDSARLGFTAAEYGLRLLENERRDKEFDLKLDIYDDEKAERKASQDALKGILGPPPADRPPTTPTPAAPSLRILGDPSGGDISTGIFNFFNGGPPPAPAQQPGWPMPQQAPTGEAASMLQGMSDAQLDEFLKIAQANQTKGTYSEPVVRINEEIDRRRKLAVEQNRAAYAAQRAGTQKPQGIMGFDPSGGGESLNYFNVQ